MSAPAGSSSSTSAVWQVIVTDSEGHTASTRVTITLTVTSNQPPLAIGSAQTGKGWNDFNFDPSGHICRTVNTGDGVEPLGGSPAAVFPTGGTGSYNYSWTYSSGDNTITVNNSSLQSPTFSKFMCTGLGTSSTSANWLCSVTDTGGNGPVTTLVSIQLNITLEND